MARDQELMGRNRQFLDRIEREVAQDRLEAREAERQAMLARQNRRVEEARRRRLDRGRRREEHRDEVARGGMISTPKLVND